MVFKDMLRCERYEGRWVRALLAGVWLNVWLARSSSEGYKVQICADGPYRLVKFIIELDMIGT
jgi:hypothetical protein